MTISLFYHYYSEPHPPILIDFIRSHCKSLSLHGRIRVASEGVNGTVGGADANVESFEDALTLRIGSQVDFKHSPGDATAFPTLHIRLVDELVTLGAGLGPAAWTAASPHISPADFLTEMRTGNATLLDVRNGYESAIGRFRGAVLPQTRQFADLPNFLQSNAETFRGKRVLLYCTGGVRCETASVLLARLGVADSIAQLRGGIHRFLEAFPDGAGVFCGKNLVFDRRGAIPAVGSPVIGKCVVCDVPWDCYAQGFRCSQCRARVLLCEREECGHMFYDHTCLRKGRCDACMQNVSVTQVRVRRRRRKRKKLLISAK